MEEDDFSSLSLEDKLIHKSWKARQAAYDELGRKFRIADSPKDALFREYYDAVKQCPLEANAVALENALSCLLAYLECSDVSFGKRLRTEIAGTVAEKGLAAARTGTRQRTLEVLLCFVEVDGSGEGVVNDLLPYWTHKQPKLLAGSISSISELIKAFGCKVVNPKAVIHALPGPFAHADKAVRSEASLLVQELHKWCGSSVLAALQSHLKPLQLKELSEACAQLPASQPTPSRYLRGQGPIPDIANESMLSELAGSSHESMPSVMEVDYTTASAAIPATAQTVPKVMDAYDLVQPVDVMSKLPSLDGLTSSAWKERKECLDAILAVVKVPRIHSDARLGELVQALAARLADVNVMCVIAAANAIEAISCGLRAAFSAYRAAVLPALLERCKERKASVLDALRAALDSLRFSLTPAQLASELIPEDLASFAAHKNPSVKAELFAWLARFTARSSGVAGKKEFKALCELALPAMDDGNTEVREAAADLLGVCWRLLGEAAASALFADRLDKIKLNKIKGRSVGTSNASSTGSTGTTASSTTSATAVPAAKSVAKPVVQAPAAPPPTTQPNKKAALMTPAVPATPVSIVSEEEALSICTEWLGEALVAGLSDSVWKNRLQAMDDIFKIIDETVELPVGMSAETVVKFFAARPGWKESNFQVTGRVINCLLRLSKFTFFSSEAMSCLLPGLIEKLSDAKLKSDCSELFMVLAEQVGLTPVIASVSAAFATQKSPKIQADILKWLQSAIEAFGVGNSQFNSSGLLDACRSGLTASNPAVRQATVALAGSLRLALGPDFRSLFADLPAASLTVLDGEFSRVAALGEGLTPPTRMSTMSTSTMTTTSSGAATCMTSESLQSPSNDDLVPKVNINSQITDALLVKFNDASWKVRKEALDECAGMLQAAAMRIKYTGHELFTAVKGRYLDANKNLTVQALELTAAFAEAMGSAFDKPFRTILLAPVLQCLADAKPQVRQAGLKALDKALLVCPLNGILSAAPTALAPDSPNLRRELLAWIASAALAAPSVTGCKEELLDLVGPVTLCLQDRSGDVRKAAQTLLAALLDVLSVEAIKRACTEQQPKLLPSLLPILEAARGKKPAVAPVTAAITSGSPAPVAPTAPRTPQRSASMRPSVAGVAAVRPTTPLRPSHSLQSLDDAPSQIQLQQQQQQQECPITTSDPAAKITRAERERLHRWSLDAPKREIVDALREQMIPHFASALLGRLFSEDFREQGAAMTRLEDWLSVATDDLTRARLTANSDLLVKYLALRFSESANTAVFSKALELTESVMSCLDACNYRLTEYEAAIFLPILINKLGDGKETLRGKMHGIFRQICRIYPASKTFTFVLDGLRNKNSRTRAECLDELGRLLSRNGLSVLTPAKHLPLIAGMIADRDPQVRNAALNFLVNANSLMGPAALQKYLTALNQRDLDLLEERLKRVAAGEPIEAVVEASADVDMEDAPLPQVIESAPIPTTETTSITSAISQSIHYDLPTPSLPHIRRSFEPSALSHPLDQAIDQIQFSTDLVCIHALQLLEGYLNDVFEGEDSGRLGEVCERVDALVHSLLVRLKEACSITFDIPELVAQKNRLCRYVCNALVLVLDSRLLARTLSEEVLQLLIAEMLAALCSDRLPLFDDHELLEQSLNLLIVKFLTNVPVNRAYRSLLSVLKEAFRTPPTAESALKFPELALKCTWKLTRGLSGRLDSLDCTALLADIHGFLLALPPIEWKMRANESLPFADLPLRTMKTILAELVEAGGLSVLQALPQIPELPESFLFSYLKTLLVSKGHPEEAIDQAAGIHQAVVEAEPVQDSVEDVQMADGSDSVSMEAEPTSSDPSLLSQAQIDGFLREVCAQICSKPDTRLGLQQLFDFRAQHSYARPQIEAFLAGLGDFFYKYIQRSLDRLEMEQSQLAALRRTHSVASAGEPVSVEAYKAKLLQLRQQIFGDEVSSSSASASSASNENHPPTHSDSPGLRRAVSQLESPKTRAIRLNNAPSTPTKLSAAMDLASSMSTNHNSPSSQQATTTASPTSSSILSLKERLARLRGQQ